MDWSTALADPESLRAEGLFLAEGRLVLARVLAGAAGGADAIVGVLATPAAARALHLDEDLPARLTIRTPAEMEALTGFNFHRGVLALVRRPPAFDVRQVIAAATAGWDSRPYPTAAPRPDDGPRRFPEPVTRCPVLVVAEHLVDVDNVGSCFRNARAFGAACVLLDDRCADPLYRKAVRTSLGHVLEVPWARAPTREIVSTLHDHGVATIGLTPHAGDGLQAAGDLKTVVDQLGPVRAIAVVVGNEGSGLSAETLSACTHLACIPMAEGADSLNVATALAVALYELRR